MQICMNWSHIRAFEKIAENGTLTAAAKALGLSQPTLSRQLRALEADLGIALFETTGTGLMMTDAAKDLLVHARAMADSANKFALIATGRNANLEGTVSLTATEQVAVRYVPQIIEQLDHVAPKISIQILVSDEVQDLQRREADIAIRHVRPEQGDLIARLVCEHRAFAYASQSYIDRYGMPKFGQPLTGHRFLAYGNHDRVQTYLAQAGVEVKDENFHHDSSDGFASWELVKRGFAIGIADEALAMNTPGMVQVLTGMQPLPIPFWLVSHRELQTSPKIRLVFDTMAAFFEAL